MTMSYDPTAHIDSGLQGKSGKSEKRKKHRARSIQGSKRGRRPAPVNVGPDLERSTLTLQCSGCGEVRVFTAIPWKDSEQEQCGPVWDARWRNPGNGWLCGPCYYRLTSA